MNNLLNLKFNALDSEIKTYAENFKVPIIYDDGLAFLETLIRIHQPKEILEIGCAIGYSAMRMQRVCNSFVTTIERKEEMYNKAIEFVSKANLDDKIRIILKDAEEALENVSDRKYDFIFIDAAKAQYHKFFDLYAPLLNEGGVIVCDNMLFHGLIEAEEKYDSQTRAVRGLIRKLKNFHDYLLNHPDYETSIFNIGDGMAVSKKKSKSLLKIGFFCYNNKR